MQFLRSLFWVIVAVAMLIFAVQNNILVTVNLWGGLQADVKLWLLVLGPLLLGFLPTWIFGRVGLWRQKRQAGLVAQRASGTSDALPVFDPYSDGSPRQAPIAAPTAAPTKTSAVPTSGSASTSASSATKRPATSST